MLKIDNDEEEFDEEGNPLPPKEGLKPGEVNSLRMPIFRPSVRLAHLPPGIPGTPAQYAPSVNIQVMMMNMMLIVMVIMMMMYLPQNINLSAMSIYRQ